jgi:NAD/NADP transhydrogenase alpha subunit
MKLAVPAERRTGETRVAVTPDTVKRLKGLGLDVVVESGAGVQAAATDAMYQDAGATIAADAAAALADADIVFKVQRPMSAAEGRDELSLMKRGALLVAMMAPYQARDTIAGCAQRGVDAVAMELLPRITRAQTMDVLSSQANLAGYKAVLEAAAMFGRAFPMMMTAAGTVAPAKVMVMGAGVAGLQAIATARRLGAVVSATDVRMAAKEQVQSLGATFVMVEDEESKQAETAGGYAKEMSDAYKQKQAALIADTLKKQDDHDRADPRQAGAEADQRRDGRIHETGRRDHRHGGRRRRQLRADRTGQDGREAWCEHRRHGQSARAHSGRRERPLRAQPVQLPVGVLRQEGGQAEPRPRRRDREGRAAHARRPDRPPRFRRSLIHGSADNRPTRR